MDLASRGVAAAAERAIQVTPQFQGPYHLHLLFSYIT